MPPVRPLGVLREALIADEFHRGRSHTRIHPLRSRFTHSRSRFHPYRSRLFFPVVPPTARRESQNWIWGCRRAVWCPGCVCRDSPRYVFLSVERESSADLVHFAGQLSRRAWKGSRPCSYFCFFGQSLHLPFMSSVDSYLPRGIFPREIKISIVLPIPRWPSTPD